MIKVGPNATEIGLYRMYLLLVSVDFASVCNLRRGRIRFARRIVGLRLEETETGATYFV